MTMSWRLIGGEFDAYVATFLQAIVAPLASEDATKLNSLCKELQELQASLQEYASELTAASVIY